MKIKSLLAHPYAAPLAEPFAETGRWFAKATSWLLDGLEDYRYETQKQKKRAAKSRDGFFRRYSEVWMDLDNDIAGVASVVVGAFGGIAAAIAAAASMGTGLAGAGVAVGFTVPAAVVAGATAALAGALAGPFVTAGISGLATLSAFPVSMGVGFVKGVKKALTFRREKKNGTARLPAPGPDMLRKRTLRRMYRTLEHTSPEQREDFMRNMKYKFGKDFDKAFQLEFLDARAQGERDTERRLNARRIENRNQTP